MKSSNMPTNHVNENCEKKSVLSTTGAKEVEEEEVVVGWILIEL